MKKFNLILAVALLSVLPACNNDLWDSIHGIENQITTLDARVTRLEELCKEMNTNITALQTIVNVLQSNDYITSVTEVKKGGEVIGYTITFGKHNPITIYHGENGTDGRDGKDGKDGTNGQDGHTPVIGVAQDTDGIYYWTLDGEWLLDDNGNKLRVTGENGADGTNGTNGTNGTDGITPQLKIENDYWYISYDNGATWTQLGKAKGDKGDKGDKGTDGTNGTNGTNGKDGKDGDSMFLSVTYDDNNVYFTLTNGTVLTVSKNGSSVQIINGTIMVPFSVSATKNVYFSQGNLQYNAMQGTHQCVDGTTKKGTWRFAENQWDIIGEDNKNNSSSYNGWIDLFAWGTSGYKYTPDSLYQASSSSSKNHLAISGDIESTKHDWGYYNAISNADHNFEWRTLNHDEWEYLLSNHDWYLATVNNIKGMILLPKSYEEPTYIYHTNQDVDFAKYVYNLKTWNLLENQGAVFLPSAGQLSCSYLGTVSYATENRVTYWTSSLCEYKASTSSSSYSYVMWRSASFISYAAQELYYPVRLVRDVE